MLVTLPTTANQRYRKFLRRQRRAAIRDGRETEVIVLDHMIARVIQAIEAGSRAKAAVTIFG